MKLYRDYKTTPKFLVPKLAQELEELNRKAEAISASNPIDFIKQMGPEAAVRRAELQQIAGRQLFTNDEANARDFAGEKGFVIVLDVPDEVAWEHYAGEQLMSPEGTPRYSSNCTFTGRELQNHPEDWKLDLINIDEERAIAEKEKHDKVSEGIPPIDRTIRGDTDLSSREREKIQKFRETMIKRDGGKSPFGGGESRS